MTDKVQLIKEEIEKKRQLIWPTNTGEMKVVDTPNQLIQGWLNCLKWIEDFIDDSLPEPVSEDLEEEIENWMKRYVVGKDLRVINNDGADITPSDIYQIAHHFAEWQRKRDQETIELAEDHAMLAGMNKMKEEMMKDAVDAIVHQGLYSKYVTECDDKALANALKNYNSGDKVKIIILKGEQ